MVNPFRNPLACLMAPASGEIGMPVLAPLLIHEMCLTSFKFLLGFSYITNERCDKEKAGWERFLTGENKSHPYKTWVPVSYTHLTLPTIYSV